MNSLRRDASSPLSLIVLIAVLSGVTTGLLVTARSQVDRRGDADNNVADPTNLATLVAVSDIIVEAEVGPTAYRTVFAGYNAQGTLIVPSSPTPPSISATALPAFQMPLTDYTINDVANTIRDCDGVVATPGALRVRMIGDPPSGASAIATDNASEYPIGQENDARLFFLSKNPDNSTYGLYFGPCSRVAFDWGVVTCSDGLRRQLSFMEDVTVEEFTDAVATEVAQQSCP